MRLPKGCNFSCDISEHGPERGNEVVPQPSGDRPGSHRLLSDPIRTRKVFLLTLPHSAGQYGIVEQDVVLVVELETAAVHVRRTDQGELAIQRQRFRMQQAACILEDLNPRREQVRVVAAAGRADDPRIVSGRKDNRRCPRPGKRSCTEHCSGTHRVRSRGS